MKTKLVKDFIGNIINFIVPFKSEYEKIQTDEIISSGYIQKGYDYGCQPGQYKMVVYRITYTKPDGNVIEFTWDQIKDYCSKYELEHVREFYHGTLKHWMMENKPEFPDFSTPGVENIGDAFFDELQTSYNMEKKDPYCSSGVFSEGIILRIDGKSSFSAYKLKAKNFLNHETIELDSGVENIEDQN